MPESSIVLVLEFDGLDTVHVREITTIATIFRFEVDL